jgi:hypothetical protein
MNIFYSRHRATDVLPNKKRKTTYKIVYFIAVVTIVTTIYLLISGVL